jgi:hypothetical protein
MVQPVGKQFGILYEKLNTYINYNPAAAFLGL